MTQPLLSILIPTVVGREKQLCYLVNKLQAMRQPNSNLVEIVWRPDNKEMTIGEKRELMYQEAKGLYSVQWDDDDDISENGLNRILEHTLGNPDCITYEEYCSMDGIEYKSNHSLFYGDWEGDGSRLLEDGFHYHRTPFFKSVIKTQIARSVPIPHIRFGEDHQWSQALRPFLKTEAHIPEQIYRYIHVSSNHIERYGLDKD